MVQFGRQKQLNTLIGIADAGVQRGQMPPLTCGITALLLQFTLCSGQRLFAFIDLACRQFNEMLPHGVTELPLHQH